MDNDALVAALGMDAVAAVRGYRLRVVAEAERLGLCLVAGPPMLDPIDIRLSVDPCAHRPWLTGRLLCWGPATGWLVAQGAAHAYYAGPFASPVRLVPSPSEVARWAAGEIEGSTLRPTGVELDDDPRAIRRLLDCLGAPLAHAR